MCTNMDFTEVLRGLEEGLKERMLFLKHHHTLRRLAPKSSQVSLGTTVGCAYTKF